VSANPIEARVKTWIGTATAASTRVYNGSRMQSTTLPAIVFEVAEGAAAALKGPTNNDVDQWSVTLKTVAETQFAAQDLAEAAIVKINAHVDFSTAGKSVCYEPTYRVIEEPILGEGDEAAPAICTATLIIMHRI
jgi:hypothetical protein